MPAGYPMSAEQIAEIAVRYSAGESVRSIAAGFGIGHRSVSLIARRGGASVRPRYRRNDTPRDALIPCGWIVASPALGAVSGRVYQTEDEGRRALACRNVELERDGGNPAVLFGLLPVAVSDAGGHCEHTGGPA